MATPVSPSRVEALLRTVGIGTWVFVGTPTVLRWVRGTERLASMHAIEWLCAFVIFGAAFWIGTDARTATRRRTLLLGLQSLAALVLALRTPDFEGALLAVVSAQMPAVVPLGVAAAWMSAQAIPLFVIVYPSHHLAGSLQATGAYVAFSVFAMGVVYLREREALARRDLARVNGELVAMQRLLAENSRAGERLRIARDLHDSVGHHLTALTMQLELARRSSPASAPVDDAAQIAKTLLSEVREIVSATRAEGTIDLGPALRALTEIPEPHVHCMLPDTFDRIDAARAHAIFRCVQEAITNAIRHGDARNVWIEIEQREGAIHLRARDDGRGAATVRLGNGLVGMRERLAALDGTLDVQSDPGKGFVLAAKLPVAR